MVNRNPAGGECLIANCKEASRSRGLCKNHYEAWRKRNKASLNPYRCGDVTLDWIKGKTEIIPWSGCWIWMGPTNRGGYGRVGNKGKATTVHRLVFELANGVDEVGGHICHRCDIPCCVNPDHLFVASHAENMRDKAIKLRAPTRKLTPAQAADVIKRCSSGESQRAVASIYKIDQTSVRDIMSGRSWGWLPDRKSA